MAMLESKRTLIVIVARERFTVDRKLGVWDLKYVVIVCIHITYGSHVS